MSKGPLAFRSISETADALGVQQHVLRFWETKFTFIRPTKRAGGRRFYRPQDIELLAGVKVLLHDRGYTIRGVQKLFKDEGQKALIAAARGQAVPMALPDDEPEAVIESPVTPPLPQTAAPTPEQAPQFDFSELKDLPVAHGVAEEVRARLLIVAQNLEAAQKAMVRTLNGVN
ncbi:MerR family transcriptional regulator [Asticcacaulis sp. BYS171W]|uniref:MerR family transcriptional regulator n=1 Tax=Asticcacaulis aquaticus TaxID=2984212 RepID=A0ABT5HP98_9CAUL|nr:MerR family transcriptional regulator [Asticcacaulis aquaticus]